MVVLDSLDRRILQQLSEGISSYEELARECNVTRNTVYRRIAVLERNGVLRRITRAEFNYDRLDISSIDIELNASQRQQKEILECLKDNGNVKFLYRAYGSYDIIVHALCDKGKEGQTINEIKTILGKFNVSQMVISVCFALEKADYSPFPNLTPLDNQAKVVHVVHGMKEQILA